jgi:flagellin
MAGLAANGISNSGAFTFSNMKFGDDKQAITLSAMDNAGILETKTITLANNAATNTAGANIDSAVAYINKELQASTGNPALQQIMAVVQNVGASANGSGGTQEINFVSNLSNFTVGIGGTANADGLHGGIATQVSSQSNGSGANMSIDTQTNAEAAVTAVTNAVSKLGTAQAAVGIGENQLNYAINLASSQITNYSAAESQIRDADVAAQAANLTKAQVLQQANIAAMAQANSAPQAVLKLLQG